MQTHALASGRLSGQLVDSVILSLVRPRSAELEREHLFHPTERPAAEQEPASIDDGPPTNDEPKQPAIRSEQDNAIADEGVEA